MMLNVVHTDYIHSTHSHKLLLIQKKHLLGEYAILDKASEHSCIGSMARFYHDGVA